MNKIEKIKELTNILNKASYNYYNYGTSDLSDEEFDYKLEQLKNLEIETGFKMSNSPVDKVGYTIVAGQNKVKHDIPMLSLEKVHSAKEVVDFAENEELIAMFKMDGISIRAIYNDKGDIISLCSRGSGEEGTDLYYQRFSFDNLPLHIDVNRETIIDGEAIITDEDFDTINNNLPEDLKYSHSRNLTAGSLALLDTSISSKRHLKMIAWDVIKGCEYNDFDRRLEWAKNKGFDIVNWFVLDNVNIKNIDNINDMLFGEAKKLGYKIDGVVWKYNSVSYGKTKGKTSHHFCNAVAFKAANEVYETILEDIEFQVSKTGLINPVAKFKEVDLDGALTTRATLHNLSYIENLELGIGDRIGVIRSNEVIPRVVDNYTRSNTWDYVKECPVCGESTQVIISDSGAKTLICPNPNCKGKLLGKLELFCSKEGMDIKGLSTSQLQTFINHGWLNDISDIYSLHNYKKEMSKLPGFGVKSVTKLLEAIENSRLVTLDKFVRSLGINLIGKSASKDLTKFVNGDITLFEEDINNRIDFSNKIDGFGEKMNKSLYDWFDDELNRIIYDKLKKELTFIGKNPGVVTQQGFNKFMNAPVDDKTKQNNTLNNKTFCITGKLNHYTNRDVLVAEIERYGGKYVNSVSSKTNYLINNDKNSPSSKNKKAAQVGCEIISEEDFMKMIGE